ncbi:MAG: lysylphosphatidylglycerol synthase transmembrane domain-containing protein [Pseudomonadota bacterium]
MLRGLYLLLGLGLLAFVVWDVDLAQVGDWMVALGWLGALAVIAVYFIAFLVDTAAWHLMLPSARLTAAWLYVLWKIRMVGEAFNVVIAMGGEPVKAVLLKRHEGISYQESAASLVIAKTVFLLALLVFAAVGLIILAVTQALPDEHRRVAEAGLAALTLGVAGFFAVQRWQAASYLAERLPEHPWSRPLIRLLAQMQKADGYFVAFYAKRRGRFAWAFALAFLNWMLSAAELYLIMALLGQPVTWAEAWMMETMFQLIRAGTFFIPANIGASEAGLMLIVEAVTGQAPLGLAVALIRRAKDLLWIAWGFLIGWRYSFKPVRQELEAAQEASKSIEEQRSRE